MGSRRATVAALCCCHRVSRSRVTFAKMTIDFITFMKNQNDCCKTFLRATSVKLKFIIDLFCKGVSQKTFYHVACEKNPTGRK